MKINDDTIRSAFVWPVRYNADYGYIEDGEGMRIFDSIYQGEAADSLGESIAAMLNERYAPKGG